MLGVYCIISAAVMLVLNIPFDVFTSSRSWWLAPLLFIGITLLFIILHILVLVISILLVNPDKPSKDTGFFRFTVYGFIDIAFKILRIKVHSNGLDKIPENEPFLLVCNHIHNLDPVVIYSQLPDARIAFVAKKEVRTLMPFVYKAIHKLSGLPIDRENNREAVKTIVSAANLIKNGENSVAIFPEGYTSASGELQPMRNGAFKIATKAKCKIAVCTLWGTKNIMKNMFRRKTDIYFNVVDVIDASQDIHTAQLGETVHSLMEESLEKIKND